MGFSMALLERKVFSEEKVCSIASDGSHDGQASCDGKIRQPWDMNVGIIRVLFRSMLRYVTKKVRFCNLFE